MIIEAFGEKKNVMDWLEDKRINVEVTRDIIVKRYKRGWSGEETLTFPVNRGASKGDTPSRIKAREEKTRHRVKMFKLAQKIRRDYENGVAVEEIMDRYGISKSQTLKTGGKIEWYNIWWSGSRTPKEYEQYLPKDRDVDTTEGDDE
jgi:DNA invertase Pin-like site-specific DNA recombinase